MSKYINKKRLWQYVQISLGVILLNLGFYFFLNPSKLVLGGMMGIATLLEPIFLSIGSWFTASIFLYIVNIICLIVGGVLLGKDFFIKTIYASLFSPTVLLVLERAFNPEYFTSHLSLSGTYFIPLLCGGLLTGFGIGLAIKNNGSTGGMDVIQKCMSKYLHVPYSKTMYLTDWVVVIVSGLTFTSGFYYNLEMVIYGSLGILLTSILVDKIVLNARSRRTAYIITSKPIEVRDMLYTKISRGVTFSNVEGGYTGEEKVMVICTMEKSEAYRLTDYVKEVDPIAFTFITACSEVVGEYSEKKKRLW